VSPLSIRASFATLAVLILANCSSPPRKATAFLASASVSYYDIRGTTAHELRRELDAKGPKWAGPGFDAYTKWYFRWNWPGYGRSDCDLSAAIVNADIEVTFPRWSGGNSAPSALLERWLRYIDALAKHENGHVELATNHRAIILQAIRSSTCDSADEAARHAVQSLNALNADYDLKTRHGRRDDTTFP
jgi:predicted secreted Zn-dependent protease